MFIVILTYKKSMAKIDAELQSHREFLERYYQQHKIMLSGPQEPRDGGVIVMNASSRSEVLRIITEDPFYIHDFAEYEIIEFTPTKYDSRLAEFIEE